MSSHCKNFVHLKKLFEQTRFVGEHFRLGGIRLVGQRGEVAGIFCGGGAVGRKACGQVGEVRKRGDAESERKGAEQFFVQRAHLAFVEHVHAFAVRKAKCAPEFRVLEVTPDQYARTPVGQIVATQRIAFAKTRARRDAVAYAEQSAARKYYHAVVAFVVHYGACGGEHGGTGQSGKPHQGGDGILFALEFTAHIQSAYHGAVQANCVAAFRVRKRDSQGVLRGSVRYTIQHALLYAAKTNPAPCGAGKFIYGVPEESYELKKKFGFA